MKLNWKEWTKNRKLLIGGLAAVLVLGIAIYAAGNSESNNQDKDARTHESSSSDSHQKTEDSSQKSVDGNTKDDEKADENQQTASVSSGAEAGRQWVAQYEELMKRKEQEATQKETEKEEFSLPYSIPMSSLVVKNMISYSGIYLEDGSDEEISDVATILIENTGDQGIEYADIEMRAGSETLHFIGTAIPPKSKMIIMAKDRAPMPSEPVTQCSAAVTDGSDFSMSEDLVQVTEGEDHAVILKNVTEEEIPMVRVFYKFYMEEQDTYVGGITYTIKAEDVEPGVEYEMLPSHYSGDGESKILMVRTYASKEE